MCCAINLEWTSLTSYYPPITVDVQFNFIKNLIALVTIDNNNIFKLTISFFIELGLNKTIKCGKVFNLDLPHPYFSLLEMSEKRRLSNHLHGYYSLCYYFIHKTRSNETTKFISSFAKRRCTLIASTISKKN